jgi:16S rRNA (cytosine967-C5)-methyltransferase
MRVTGLRIALISPARRAAFDVLSSVAGGAYASDALRERCAALEARDAGLAGQIVFGCLRFQSQLDYLISHYSGKSPDRLDTSVRIPLRMAIFQLRYLDRIPPHAAVHECVELVKQQRRAAAGFANAVLRKVTREPVSWPSEDIELSIPAWLLARWKDHFGEQTARSAALAALAEPAPYIRVPRGATLPTGLNAEPAEIEGAYLLTGPAPAGLRLHDIGSQAIIPLLDLRPEHSFLDLCAAPGNKTLQALESAPRLAIACDISEKRLREVPPICSRLVLDATQTLPFSCRFDRIFIDAPCSGTGTLARNPEIKWRVQPDDFARFQQKQLAIAARAAHLLPRGGKLLYATCSLEREENEDVVRAVLEAEPHLVLERTVWRVPGRDTGDGFFAAIFTTRTNLA